MATYTRIENQLYIDNNSCAVGDHFGLWDDDTDEQRNGFGRETDDEGFVLVEL